MKLDPAAFRDLVVRRRDACVKFKDGKPSRDRREAMQFYRGDNLDLYGDSGDGLSTVVSRDTLEAVESMMPPLLEPFVAGEEVVSFDPVEENDKDATQQATDYVNGVFSRHNNPLDVVQTALKDGLLFRLGIAKTVAEQCEEGSPETYDRLDDGQLQALQAAAQGQRRDLVGDIAQDPATGLHTAVIAPKKAWKYRVHIIAPDEFLYEERLADLSQAGFLGHSKRITLADLIDMGVDAKTCRTLKSGKPSDEQDDRFRDEGRADDNFDDDDLSRPVWVDECYIRADVAGDGQLEWRKVLLGGSEKTLLLDEAADDHPYSVWTPIPIPHKLAGLSVHDLCRDVQMQKTALQREQLNNLYLVNRPQREVLDGMVNIDDLLNPALNGTVRVKQMGAINQLLTPFVAEKTFPMIEYLDGVRESRTGVTRYNQGMDANSLNKTATGVSIISSNSQLRQKLIARQFGEFMKDVFEKMLALVSQHADEADVQRMTGKPFVPWPTDYDTNVSVGLGNNNKDQLAGHVQMLLQLDAQIVQLQQGIQGPLLTAENIYEKLKMLPAAMGIKNANFYTDPSAQEQPQAPPQAQPDPNAGKAETEIAKAKIAADSAANVAHIHGGYKLAETGLYPPPQPMPAQPVDLPPNPADPMALVG